MALSNSRVSVHIFIYLEQVCTNHQMASKGEIAKRLQYPFKACPQVHFVGYRHVDIVMQILQEEPGSFCASVVWRYLDHIEFTHLLSYFYKKINKINKLSHFVQNSPKHWVVFFKPTQKVGSNRGSIHFRTQLLFAYDWMSMNCCFSICSPEHRCRNWASKPRNWLGCWHCWEWQSTAWDTTAIWNPPRIGLLPIASKFLASGESRWIAAFGSFRSWDQCLSWDRKTSRALCSLILIISLNVLK